MGKYYPLTKWLSESNADSITLSFSMIEDIISFKLPESAYKHRAWWSNSNSHPEAIAWMEAGYITSDCSDLFTKNLVEFSKSHG